MILHIMITDGMKKFILSVVSDHGVFIKQYLRDMITCHVNFVIM